MAFTETTFSLLRESVKQSMQDDKQKGLLTSEVIRVEPMKNEPCVFLNYVIELAATVKKSSFSEALFYVSDELKVSIEDVYEKDGVVLTDVSKLDNDKITHKKGMRIGRALKWLVPDASDKDIKGSTNAITKHYSSWYVYFTDREINKHYRVLAVTRNLRSCMSKRPRFYGIIRENTTFDDPEWVRYIHPTEAYNHSPNLRLALLSKYAPDSKEFNAEGQYPFDARAIVMIDVDINGEPFLRFSRGYGIEYCESVYTKAGIENINTEGGLLNIIRDGWGDIVAPYVDCENSLSIADGGEHLCIDECGGYTVEHDRGILHSKCRCFCGHCNEYHENERDEDDYIYVEGVGNVYGDCRDNYCIPVGRNDYYHKDDCYWSGHEGDYVLDRDAIEFITDARYDYVVTCHAHENSLGDGWIVELERKFKGYAFASVDQCIQASNGKYFIEIDTEAYFEFNGEYYDVDDGVYSVVMKQMIPWDDATEDENGDWVTQEYLDENTENNDEEELDHAA